MALPPSVTMLVGPRVAGSLRRAAGRCCVGRTRRASAGS